MLSDMEVMHIRGLSSDGVVGMNPIQLQRTSIGVAMAGDDYAARFLENDATPRGVLERAGEEFDRSPELQREFAATQNPRQAWIGYVRSEHDRQARK